MNDNMNDSTLYAGVMTGTSLDGLDAVLADFTIPHAPRVLASISVDYPQTLRQTMLALQAGTDGMGLNELHRSQLAGIALANLHNTALQQLFALAGVAAHEVAAIGVHGQTVRHAPDGILGSAAYTVQLLDATCIVEALQCTVVHNFRSRDVAAGGQGAPLVPAFHAAVCHKLHGQVAVVNIGGFANVTLLANQAFCVQSVQGLDTGPGNVLMDEWIQQHLQQPYDIGGAWAATGHVHQGLLKQLMAHPYFVQLLPKSTGREAFNIAWLNQILNKLNELNKLNKNNTCIGLTAADVQATLCELTATSIMLGIQQYLPDCQSIYVCGGGALNTHLMQRLSSLSGRLVQTTAALGINPQQMEALAFAWLARQCLLGLAGNVPSITGALGGRVLGQITPV